MISQGSSGIINWKKALEKKSSSGGRKKAKARINLRTSHYIYIVHARTMGVVLFQIGVDECQEGAVEDVVHLLDLLEGHWVDAVVTGFRWHIIGVAYAAVETIP